MLFHKSTIHIPTTRCKAMSYVEVLVASVIITGLLISAVQLFSNVGLSQRATLENDFAENLILEMIEEIKPLYYKDPALTGGYDADHTLGPAANEIGSNRLLFNDVDDYNGYTESPPQNRQGDPYTQYSNLTRTVAVQFVSASDYTTVVASNQGYKKVTITISRDSIQLAQRYYLIPNLDILDD